MDKNTQHTPGPWTVCTDNVVQIGTKYFITHHTTGGRIASADAALIAAAPDLLAALKACKGYMLNAKIDLQTGTPKATTLDTLEGGIKMVEAELAKAEGR